MEGLKPVLALNCGSSSLKFGLYRSQGAHLELLCEGEAEQIGDAGGSFWSKPAGTGESRLEKIKFRDHTEAARHALESLKHYEPPAAVGHRFVHGGREMGEHQPITPQVFADLQDAVEFAPLHLPSALATVQAVQQELPGVPQVACLDTAFHRRLPDVSKTYALPIEVRGMGVERYGFHGLSLESILEQLRDVPQKLVVAHLGNGSSITAILNGQSVDTSMGMTPTGGVMMGTRCGDLDPGVILYLMRHGYADVEALEKLFDQQAGLLGVSAKSRDVRELLAARGEDRLAKLALAMFCYQVRKTIASMAAAVNGMDALVFTGGIGEHAAELRDEICLGLGFLGNVHTLVLPAQEDLQIARITARIVN